MYLYLHCSGSSARWALLLVILLLAVLPGQGQAPLSSSASATSLLSPLGQTNSPAEGGRPETAAETLETRLAEARTQLVSLNSLDITNAPTGVLIQEVWTRRASLQRLVRLYEQQLSNRTALEKAKNQKVAMVREAQVWRRFKESPPYSILLTDSLREEIQAERQKIKVSEGAISTIDQLIEENRTALAQAEEKIRQINEQLESAKDPVEVNRLSWQREKERLRSQVAAASTGVLDLERLLSQESLDESRIHLDLLQRQLALAQAGTELTRADVDRVASQIEHQSLQYENELAQAEKQRLAASKALESAREELRNHQGPEVDNASASRSLELVSVREAQLERTETATYVLRLMLEGLSVERTMWELRYAAHDSRNVETLNESQRMLDTFRHRLGLWQKFARMQLEWSSSQLQLQELRLNNLPPGSDLQPLTGERLEALRAREEMLMRFVRGVERMTRLSDRWAEGLRDAEGNLPITGRVHNLFIDARTSLQRLWTFEIFTAEDTIMVEGQKITGKRSITIGKIIMALLILVVGYWTTGLITALVEPIFIKRLNIEPNQANLIRRWLRALLVVCLLLFSLVSVKIPLTVFAFAGGALAIGLGFGMQTLLKNFVSGLILLFECPFRVGDVLEVNGQQGAITSIGLRASVLALWNGTETLIPNSSLLENSVNNWTYSNRRVRFCIKIGVAYGSDLRRVTQLLNEAADRHGLIEKDPKPQVLFTDFGDSTLAFELRFWIDALKVNSAQVCSDLRLMIAGTFAEHGIEIAFPQRDIHLRTDQPIPMRMVTIAEEK